MSESPKKTRAKAKAQPSETRDKFAKLADKRAREHKWDRGAGQAADEHLLADNRRGPRPSKVMRALGTVGITLLVIVAGLAYPYLARRSIWSVVDWQYPWALALLALVPFLWWWLTFGQDRRRPFMKIGSVMPLRRARRGVRVRLRDLPGVLRTVAFALLVIALARPVAVLSDQTADEQGIDIVIVMDLSGSMRAILDADPKDFPLATRPKAGRRFTRLDVAKIVVEDFISRRKTDRIGAIVFGRQAYVLSPPTLDYQLLSKLVRQLTLRVIDDSKTAMGDALGVAVARLRRSDALSKVIILLTDGDNNAGKVSPDYAISLASKVGAKIYTIQIGDGQEAEVYVGTDPLFGGPKYTRQRFPTNPALLKRIADQTGGTAFIATDAKALAESMHNILDQLEKTRFEASVAHHEDLFPLFVIPGVILIGLDALLRALLLRRFP